MRLIFSRFSFSCLLIIYKLFIKIIDNNKILCYNKPNIMGKKVHNLKRFVSLTLVISLVCVLFSACSFSPFKSTDYLMKPPVFSNTDEDLLTAFTLAAGESTVYCTPLGGDYKSAVIVEDVDGDRIEEALVFYRLKSGQGTVRLNLLERIDGEWKSVSDFSGSGTAVDSVSFIDIEGDGVKEIFTGWRVGSSTAKALSVYRRNSDRHSYQEIMNEAYSAMSWGDADSDGETEILLVNQTSTVTGTQNSANLFKYSGGKMNLTGSAKLDGNVSSYVSVKNEKIDEQSPLRFYIDALKGEMLMITELVYWNAQTSELVNPFVDEVTLTNTATLRFEPIPSMDIDNDGAIDIPVQTALSEPPQGSDLLVSSSFYQTEWKKIASDGVNLITVENSLISTTGGFILRLDKDSFERINVDAQNDKCWIFRSIDEGGGYTDLFSLLIIDTESWSDEMAESYTVLMQTDDYFVCAYISAAGVNYGMTGEKIAERFSPFNY